MAKYLDFLQKIYSVDLIEIYKSENFNENQISIIGKYSFSEICNRIKDLEEGKNLDFWKTANNELLDFIDSDLVYFYYSKYIKKENERIWLKEKNIRLLGYSLEYYCTEGNQDKFRSIYHFIKNNQNEISELLGDKWVIHKTVKNQKELLEALTAGKYKNLKSLEIGFKINSFSGFSESQKPVLNNLVYLYIPNNNLTSLEGFPNLQRLEYLNLSNNKITSFKGLPAFPRLIYLNISGNKIDSFEALRCAISWLDVSNNQITSFKYFPNNYNGTLAHLNASKNRIYYFTGLPNLSALEYLNISDNHIDSFKGFPDLRKLAELDLELSEGKFKQQSSY